MYAVRLSEAHNKMSSETIILFSTNIRKCKYKEGLKLLEYHNIYIYMQSKFICYL